MEHKFNETLTFGGTIDYWFLGSYDIDVTNTTTGAAAFLQLLVRTGSMFWLSSADL
jgi:hypothetical protein